MKTSRRSILTASLGASQLALLGALGMRPRRARAGGGSEGPTRIMSIFLRGGWMPELFFTPLDAAGLAQTVPEPEVFLGEPCFFTPQEVRNIDGTGDEPDTADAAIQRIRVPHLWDEELLAGGGVSPQTSGTETPIGWAWKHDALYEHATVLHGIDVGTAAHLSGKVSMMCGVAGPKFRSPALLALAADALADRFPERPLPSVSVANGPTAQPVTLGPRVAPTRIGSTGSLEQTLSERSDLAWGGLRDRAPHPQFAFDSSPRLEPIDTNAIDEFVLARSRRLFGTVNAGTNAFYEDFYETYSTVSRQLALDLVTELEATAGWEYFTPSWANPMGPAPFGVKYGLANGGGSGLQWTDRFELALKLFKADLCSSLSLRINGPDEFTFDTHNGADGPRLQFLNVRATLEIIGRLLHEMKATPAPGASGKTLLDDTLVVIFSEFSRTWPGTACDHWPYTSVVLAGGGMVGNRQIGNFDLDTGGYSPTGVPIPMRIEGGDEITAAPRSADVVHTALNLLGIEDFFIPGGSSEILGVRA